MNLNSGVFAFRKLCLAAGLALSVLFAPAALAQGDANWQKIVAAAKKEGSLVI